MFSALMNRAQATVDNAIGQVINRALIAIPFLLAGAFATAALAYRLIREFGPETANLMLAGIFLVVGLITAAIFSPRVVTAASATTELPEALQEADASEQAKPALEAPDRELLMAALTSAAPLAMPAILRTLLRNLPLVVAILSALFIMTRSTAPEQPAEATAPPA